MKYRKEVDGLRAVAVVPVILYHAGWSSFSGGYAGVDIFFVISGYLITSIILDENRSGTFSYRKFYLRRARRLLPALCAMILCCIPVAFWVLGPQAIRSFSESVVAAFTMTANIVFWKQTGYFAPDASLNPLLHLWSLSVEEQYYLLFPITCVFLLRAASRSFAAILLGALGLSFALAQWSTHTHPSAAFYLLPTRSWELLIGALLATPSLQRYCNEFGEKQKVAAECLGLFGIALIAFAISYYDKHTPFPGVYALAPTIGAILILAFAKDRSIVARILGMPVFVGIGLISYSAYLFHQPIFVFARILNGQELSAAYSSVLVSVCLLVAYLSWRYVEVPFRKPAVGGRLSKAFVVLPVPLILVWGISGITTDGFEHFIYNNRFNATERVVYDVMKEQASGISLHTDGACRFAVSDVDDSFERRFTQCYDRFGPGSIIIGDSHALNVYNALFLSDSSKFFIGIMKEGCRPDTKDNDCPYARVKQFVQQQRAKIGSVLYHQSGAHLLRDYRGNQDTDEIFAPEHAFAFDTSAIKATSDYLDTLNVSVPVVWLGPYTESRVNLQTITSLDSARIKPRVQMIFAQLDSLLLSQRDKNTHNWRYVSLVSALAIDSQFLWYNNCLTFRDTDHLSVCGEAIAGERLKKYFHDTRSSQILGGHALPH